MVASTVGCGSHKGPKKYAVRGAVSFQNRPVEQGQVIFEPDPARGNRGPASYGEITAGSYTLSRTKGHVGGPYIVRLSGVEQPAGTTPSKSPGDGGTPPRMLFTDRQVTIELPKADVTHDFDVPSR